MSASSLLGAALLHALTHRLDNDPQPIDADAAAFAVLSACPVGFEERLRGLRCCFAAGRDAHWALPLLLSPPAAHGKWDALTLGASAEVMHSAQVSVDACVAARAAAPLVAVVALLTDAPPDVLRRSVAECTANERSLVRHIALGFAGLTLRQRWNGVTACAAESLRLSVPMLETD